MDLHQPVNIRFSLTQVSNQIKAADQAWNDTFYIQYVYSSLLYSSIKDHAKIRITSCCMQMKFWSRVLLRMAGLQDNNGIL